MNRKYLDGVERRIARNAKFERQVKSNVKAAGCLVLFFWLCSAILSLLMSVGFLAGMVAAIYYLCTGEFILR